MAIITLLWQSDHETQTPSGRILRGGRLTGESQGPYGSVRTAFREKTKRQGKGKRAACINKNFEKSCHRQARWSDGLLFVFDSGWTCFGEWDDASIIEQARNPVNFIFLMI
jgi:hypothetical protein